MLLQQISHIVNFTMYGKGLVCFLKGINNNLKRRSSCPKKINRKKGLIKWLLKKKSKNGCTRMLPKLALRFTLFFDSCFVLCRYLLDYGILHPTEKYYPLRPEFAESTFYLYQATKGVIGDNPQKSTSLTNYVHQYVLPLFKNRCWHGHGIPRATLIVNLYSHVKIL